MNIKYFDENKIKCPYCKKMIYPVINGFQYENNYYYEEICPECNKIINEE